MLLPYISKSGEAFLVDVDYEDAMSKTHGTWETEAFVGDSGKGKPIEIVYAGEESHFQYNGEIFRVKDFVEIKPSDLNDILKDRNLSHEVKKMFLNKQLKWLLAKGTKDLGILRDTKISHRGDSTNSFPMLYRVMDEVLTSDCSTIGLQPVDDRVKGLYIMIGSSSDIVEELYNHHTKFISIDDKLLKSYKGIADEIYERIQSGYKLTFI